MWIYVALSHSHPFSVSLAHESAALYISSLQLKSAIENMRWNRLMNEKSEEEGVK